MNEPMATVFDIQRNSYVDGPGIRTTVFFKGCNLRCSWCHNPESQSPKPQMMFYQNKCTGCGKCKVTNPYGADFFCPNGARELCGKEYTAEQVWREIKKDTLFYQSSGGGVTFSGGECMLQIDFLEKILKQCKENGIHTAVDTAGHVPYTHFERILPDTDLILYDVKCLDREQHKRYTGVENGLILDNLKRLLATKKPIWIRIPIIPTVNDSIEEMQSIKSLLLSYGTPERIELLPYHAMGEHKYRAIGRAAPRFIAPDDAKMQALRAVFEHT